SGMGLGVVERLIQLGWNVTILDFNPKNGKEVEQRFAPQLQYVKGNVVNYEDQANCFVQSWERWGRLDLGWTPLRLSQGIGERSNFYAPAEENPDGSPKKPDTLVMDVCLQGIVWTAYLALHYFRKNESKAGKLVFNSSLSGLYPTPAMPLYSASKSGVVALARSLGMRLKELGEPITVNAICPGCVPTPLVPQALVDALPGEHLTPMPTIVKAVEGFIDDESLRGQVAECSAHDVIFRQILPYGNEASKFVTEGWYTMPMDYSAIMQWREVKIAELEELLRS
ncbi:NAD(P)-binding protein, partial [Rhizodiscina lignyota]